MSDKHLSSQFDADLNLISSKVLEMGGLVESQIITAMQALNEFDSEAAERVIAAEDRLNTMEVEIDEECSNIIARRQPAARDLRLVLAISKTITNLERAGCSPARSNRCCCQASRSSSPAETAASARRSCSPPQPKARTW